MAINSIATIVADKNYTAPMFVLGWFNISVYLPGAAPSGSLGGTTATVQRSFNSGTTWLDLKQYTVSTEEYGFEPEGALYRVGVKDLQYVASIICRLGAEPGMTH